eukprot:CAMPEP_0179122318 /NCGR_PEP_ID=MMETSP0796-20121207/57726_1 /TAXON_ID=73915 /ORGANISM="Pyrodinium bahamense, Strain pbaha01" /LENGTH=112 /DNA_ID=CAMNT_0020820941 /DNA_START=187 /DNA_END=525 /DNA_ORIENTATION=+
MKLIFTNDNENNTRELTLSLATTVRDLKKEIMEQHWPDSLPVIENVERLRLFAGGKELGGKGPDDAKNLRDAKLTTSGNFLTPVHVVYVLKSEEAPEQGPAKPAQQCFCTLL